MSEFQEETKAGLLAALESVTRDRALASENLSRIEGLAREERNNLKNLCRRMEDYHRLLAFMGDKRFVQVCSPGAEICLGCAEGCAKCDPCAGYGCYGGEGK